MSSQQLKTDAASASAANPKSAPHSSSSMGAADANIPPLTTSHGAFINTSTHPPRSILLRGVNIASSGKVPRTRPVQGETADKILWLSPAEDTKSGDNGDGAGQRMHSHILKGFWEGQETGGEPEGWFNGGTLDLDEETDEHLERLKGWGFNAVRYLVTWESLEHAGPGKYDDAFIAWTVRMLKKIASYGFRVYIDPHQDIWSRATGGAGAPYWTLLACGLAPRRFSQTWAAYIQCEWPQDHGGPKEFPEMIWQTNLHRLAARTMYTAFFAGETFLPRCSIDGQNIQRFLEGHFNEAFGRLADAIAREDGGSLLDTCVIGWDSLNEPGLGFIEIPDLNVLPPSQDFKKGPTPTPLQNFLLGSGVPQKDVEEWEFSYLGPKKTGSTDLTPKDGLGCWLTREEADAAASQFGWKRDYDFWGDEPESMASGDVWAAHGVWDRHEGKILIKDYFHHPKDKHDEPYDFLKDFWHNQWAGYMRRIHRSHPRAISFCNPPVFAQPPSLDHSVHQGRLALSAHFYEALTMLNKRRHVYGADAVGIQRGLKPLLKAFKVGERRIRASLQDQFTELAEDAKREESLGETETYGPAGNYPVIIGETGVPFDMRPTALLGIAKGSRGKGDYTESAKALDDVLNGCDAEDDVLGFTIWNYERRNTWQWGDGWNGENLSLWSAEDLNAATERAQTLEQLLTNGARAVQAFCRPFAVATVGKLRSQRFDIDKAEFELEIVVNSADGPDRYEASPEALEPQTAATRETAPATVIYLPYVHFRAEADALSNNSAPTSSKNALPGSVAILGKPDPAETREWSVNSGPPVVGVDVDISEGTLEIIGQYAYWRYETGAAEARKVKMVLRRTGGSLPPK